MRSLYSSKQYDILKELSDLFEKDLIILPSSIHEVILIPAYDHDSYDELTSMVKEVNSTQLSKEEILSDHVYFYSRETGQISM